MARKRNSTSGTKREFVAYWTATDIILAERVPLPSLDNFSDVVRATTSGVVRHIVRPELRFDDLRVFAGRKTRITIEVLHE